MQSESGVPDLFQTLLPLTEGLGSPTGALGTPAHLQCLLLPKRQKSPEFEH